jgi:hypothetical protein
MKERNKVGLNNLAKDKLDSHTKELIDKTKIYIGFQHDKDIVEMKFEQNTICLRSRVGLKKIVTLIVWIGGGALTCSGLLKLLV